MFSWQLPFNNDDQPGPFLSKPFISYFGHTADILDISWSKVRLSDLNDLELLELDLELFTAESLHPLGVL